MNDDERRDILLEVALALGAELQLDSLLPLILRQAVRAMEAERALFALVDANGALTNHIFHNLEWAGPGHKLPVSESVIHKAIDEGRPQLDDVKTNDETAKRKSVILNKIRFMVAQPIFVDAEIVAVLYIDSQHVPPQELDRRMGVLEGLAALAGVAIRSARLYEEQRYRAQLLAQLVHDLRTPLSVVSMNAEELEGITEGADDIAAAADRMRHMVDFTLALSRIDAGASVDEVETVDLLVEIPSHVRKLNRLARERNVQLVCKLPRNLPKVKTVLERVWVILDNLMFNAVKHSYENTTIEVRLAIRGDAGPANARNRRSGEAAHLFRRVLPIYPADDSQFVELSVFNVGDPIPPTLIPKIFDDYTRAGNAKSGKMSTGLGLSIVDQCVRYLGGAVWVDTGVTTATCFKFTLPTKVNPVV